MGDSPNLRNFSILLPDLNPRDIELTGSLKIIKGNAVMTEHDHFMAELKEDNLPKDENYQMAKCNQANTTISDNITAGFPEDSREINDNSSPSELPQAMPVTSIRKGENLYSCPYCEYITNQKNNLKTHIASVHIGDKPYSCPHCEYAASQNSNLKKHIASVHREEKPFSCPHCKYAASRKFHLNTHVASVHRGEKPYSCSHCDYSASQSSSLKTHIAAVHRGEKPYSCAHCGYAASRKSSLNRHIACVHRVENLYLS